MTESDGDAHGEDLELFYYLSGAFGAVGAGLRPSVLVVEDDTALRTSMCEILTGAGFMAVGLPDGEEALRVLRTLRFDVMVLDLRMPSVDGSSLPGALATPTPVVIVSAHELDEDARRAMPTLVLRLEKPVQPQQLVEAVDKATRARRTR